MYYLSFILMKTPCSILARIRMVDLATDSRSEGSDLRLDAVDYPYVH